MNRRPTVRVRCAICSKETAGRLPQGGDGTLYFPRRHQRPDGVDCEGNYMEAEWLTDGDQADALEIEHPHPPSSTTANAGDEPDEALVVAETAVDLATLIDPDTVAKLAQLREDAIPVNTRRAYRAAARYFDGWARVALGVRSLCRVGHRRRRR